MLHPSRLLMWMCIVFIMTVGIATAHSPPRLFTSVLVILVVGVLLELRYAFQTLRRCAWLQPVAWLLLAASVGIGRAALLPREELFAEFSQQFTATVVREPIVHTAYQQVLVAPTQDTQTHVTHDGMTDGFIQLSAQLHPRVEFGDQLTIECGRITPTAVQPQPYRGFLRRHNTVASCSRASVRALGFRPSLRRQLFAAKRFAMLRLQHAIPSPENTILLGVLFGVDDALPENLATAFRNTGTMHVLVISGSNVVLLTSILLGLFVYMPISKRTAVCAALAVLALYAVLTGLQPPAVRATLFGSIALIATLAGRRGESLRLLVFSAVVMLCINPLLLLFDAGFQLSFLATAGIIICCPWLRAHLAWIPEMCALRTSVATTLAAMLFTTPLIVYAFQSFSWVALPTNILIVPLMNIVMLGGLIAVVLSLVLPSSLAALVCLPLVDLLHVVIRIVEWVA